MLIQRLFEQLIRYRWFSLIAVAVLTVAAMSQLPKLEIDNSNESFFMTGDPTKERLDQFQETFGNDDFVFILVDVADAFDQATLTRLATFAERLEQQVPHLLDLTWIGNVEWIEGVPGGIQIDDFVPEFNLPQAQLDALRRRATADPLYRERLVGSEAQSVGILMEFENYPDIGIDPRKDVPPVILEIVADFDDLDTHVVGGPVMDYVMDEKTAVEAPTWMAAALLGMMIMLAITTRSVVGVLVPAATVVLSVIWVMGLVAVIGWRLNLLVILVPTLMLCVGIGDTMHVVAEFKQHLGDGMARRHALISTLSLVSGPLVLTTLTTATGFLAFTVIDLTPMVELGIQATIGVLVAFLLTYIFAVPMLSFGSDPDAEAPRRPPDLFDRILRGASESVIRNKAAYGIGFALVTGIALYGVTLLKIETNTIKDLPANDPLRLAFEYVDDNMGGSMSLEFVVDTKRENGTKNLEVLSRTAQLQAFLDQHPLVTQTSSVIDQLKQMNRAVHENRPDYYRLPESDAQIAEYLLLYESAGGAQLEKYVGFTYDQLRVQARTQSIALADTRKLRTDVATFAKERFGSDVDVYTTGALATFERIADLVAVGQGRSFLIAFGAITLIMMLTLKSVPLGLISMVPNVFPVALALGAMGLAGAQLNIVGLVLAPMIIGVAVDDTVHFFFRYRRYFEQTQDYDAAYRETMRTVGRPLLFTTLVLCVGFSGFAYSDFAGPRNFAWTSIAAFSGALLAEFLLVPVLLDWLKPLGKPTPTAAEGVSA